MSRLDSGYLIIGVIFAIDLIMRLADPDSITPEYIETLNGIVPMVEILFLFLLLVQTVPRLVRRVRSKPIHDVVVYSCFFIACGLAILVLPDFIPADATKEDQENIASIVVYSMLGAFMVVYFLWEKHKQTVAKRKNERSKAESDQVHLKALEESK